jgi:hypothetical protein
MNTNRDDSFLFASETTIFRIVSMAKIIAWIILVFYLISFAGELAALMQGQMNWPTQITQWPFAIANLFFSPVIGLFYFLVLQGVAQALNLGLDIYYQSQPDEEQLQSVPSEEPAALD